MGNKTGFEWPFAFATGPSIWKVATRLQIETLAMLSRRAQAYMELPQTLAQCHNPQDILTEQVRFWQIAQRQYMEGFDKVVGGITSAQDGTSTTITPAQRARDYIMVSQTAPAATQTVADAGDGAVREPAPRVRRSA